MRKLLTLLFVGTFGLVHGQASYLGDHSFELYGGGPNFLKFDFFGFGPNSTSNLGSTSIPPSGIRYTYMITNDVSIGIDAMYNSYRQSYLSTDTVFVNNQWTYISSNYTDLRSRLRVQARFNFLLPNSSPNLDSYIGLAVGTNNRWQKQWVNDSLTVDFNSTDLVVVPVSARLCYGFRYFFNYNSALGAEVGVGGPLFSVQYTYKF
ncbi:MAG: hypothetical protein RLZZ243_447 [Bacteroidota bacterium]|jgi:hypothetical protein